MAELRRSLPARSCRWKYTSCFVLLDECGAGRRGHDQFTFGELPAKAPATVTTLADVARAIDAKEVKTLFILNGNPAYNAAGDLKFAEKIKAVKDVYRYGYYGRQADETSALSGTFIAGLHYLESWGDGLTWDGFQHCPRAADDSAFVRGLWRNRRAGDARLATHRSRCLRVRARHFLGPCNPGKSFEEWLAVGVAGTGFATISGIDPDAMRRASELVTA